MKLQEAIEKYIERKQKDGLAYCGQGLELRSFGNSFRNRELQAVKTAEILTFLNSKKISPYTWRRKHAQLTSFFRFWHILGETPPIQMPASRGLVRQAFAPYVYSRSEVQSFLTAADRLEQNANSTIHPETFRTLLLFLYGTGARMSEAIALLSEDFDLEGGHVRIRAYGTGHFRFLPIGREMLVILRQYAKWKKALCIEGLFFLLRRDGSPLNKDAVYCVFHKVLLETGVVRRDRAPYRPRIYDFRTTFAVHQITNWMRNGAELNRLLPALAAYMGQGDLNATERFLALTPERFKKELDKLSPQKGKKWATDSKTMSFLSSL